jgi:hypothetical protein
LPGCTGHCGRLFRLWYRYRGNLRDRRGNPRPLDREQLYLKSVPLQKKLLALAEAHLDDTDREVCNMATALFTHFERLFTFLEEEGVEPTNNISERMLRTAVQWRKICFGNRSRSGELAVSRLLTVAQTCQRQQRHVLGYLTEACDVTAVRLRCLLCSRRATDHLNCYEGRSQKANIVQTRRSPELTLKHSTYFRFGLVTDLGQKSADAR